VNDDAYDAIVAGLNRWMAGADDRERAATGLLSWHEYWLRRPDFRRACLGRQGRDWYVRWDDARGYLDAGPHASGSQDAVLRVAVDLAGDRFGLDGLGRAHRQAVIDAVTVAAGGAPGAPPPAQSLSFAEGFDTDDARFLLARLGDADAATRSRAPELAAGTIRNLLAIIDRLAPAGKEGTR
jgi:hypothetical protein